jgi:hypothetical protein
MKNLDILESLIKQYFPMEPGQHIESYLEKIVLFNLNNRSVAIKRKALKHYVESRKKELIKHHSREEILIKIIQAISKVEEIFLSFDIVEEGKEGRKIISKNYANEGFPNIRIVFEETTNTELEIVSIHFRKFQKEKVIQTKKPKN